MTFTGIEYSLSTGEATGRSEVYSADCLGDAISQAYYTHSLKGPTKIGPSGRTVNYGDFSLVFKKEVTE